MIEILRKKTVVAMNLIIRQLNDETLQDGWLMCGVADGDIPHDEIAEVDDYYIQDKEYAYLMDLFLRTVKKTDKYGLHSDGIVSKGEKENDRSKNHTECGN